VLQTFFDQAEVEQINVPSTDGDFGILPSHVPVIAALKPGVVSVTQNGSVTDYFGTSCPSLPALSSRV
jgi:F0F1-type ATP synthase epsilon subunit